MALDPMNLPKFAATGDTRRENEARVRELMARVRALIAQENDDACVRALEEIEFGLGGLLPPIGVALGFGPDGDIKTVKFEAQAA